MSFPRSEMKCQNCRCWEMESNVLGEKYGVCHRYPPTVSGQVETHALYWCFEFFPNDELHLKGFKDYTY